MIEHPRDHTGTVPPKAGAPERDRVQKRLGEDGGMSQLTAQAL